MEDAATMNLRLFFVSANLRILKPEREQLCEQEIRDHLHSHPQCHTHTIKAEASKPQLFVSPPKYPAETKLLSTASLCSTFFLLWTDASKSVPEASAECVSCHQPGVSRKPSWDWRDGGSAVKALAVFFNEYILLF